jgi:methionyl-tRNA formyltransferase
MLDGRLTVACGEGAVRIVELQKAGSKAMRAEDFLRGSPLSVGTVLN